MKKFNDTFKGFIQMDDIRSSRIRKKMNKKDPKKREWGAFESADVVEESIPSTTKVPLVWKANNMNVVKSEEEEDTVLDQSPESEEETDDISIVDDGDEYDDFSDDEFNIDGDYDGEEDPEMLDGEEDQDPNKQGIIRVVKGAHLVYKRQNEEGGYDELWIYNLDNEKKDELDIRRDILAGTDIPQNKTKSEDDSQSYSMWTVGNAQLLHITGLPN